MIDTTLRLGSHWAAIDCHPALRLVRETWRDVRAGQHCFRLASGSVVRVRHCVASGGAKAIMQATITAVSCQAARDAIAEGFVR